MHPCDPEFDRKLREQVSCTVKEITDAEHYTPGERWNSVHGDVVWENLTTWYMRKEKRKM